MLQLQLLIRKSCVIDLNHYKSTAVGFSLKPKMKQMCSDTYRPIETSKQISAMNGGQNRVKKTTVFLLYNSTNITLFT